MAYLCSSGSIYYLLNLKLFYAKNRVNLVMATITEAPHIHKMLELL